MAVSWPHSMCASGRFLGSTEKLKGAEEQDPSLQAGLWTSAGVLWALLGLALPVVLKATGCLNLIPSMPDCINVGPRQVPVSGAEQYNAKKSEWPGLQWASASPGVNPSACDLLAGTGPDWCLTPLHHPWRELAVEELPCFPLNHHCGDTLLLPIGSLSTAAVECCEKNFSRLPVTCSAARPDLRKRYLWLSP